MMHTKSQFINLYKNTFRYTEHLNSNNLYRCLITNPEIFHAYNCFNKLDEARQWRLHDRLGQPSKDGYDKETMLFENRQLPHIEYLIRSVIYRFENDWNHTVVCTDDNYSYVSLMCANIHRDINIINVGNIKINQNTFNNMLLTEKFWSNFKGEKILVYQQDADIYHGDVQEYLKYDYIGPAWPKDQQDNQLQVGNGGYSIRTKDKMIECLNHVAPDVLPLMQGTIDYMDGKSYLGNPMDNPPEDVYYSKAMIDYKLGIVADHDTAKKFGNESYFTKNATGGHQYWCHSKTLFFNNICDYSNTKKLTNYVLSDWDWVRGEAKYHVSGWPGVINSCVKHGIITEFRDDNQLLIIDNLEKYFVWDNKPPIEHDWVGITHTTPNTPPYLKIVDIDSLLTNQNFIKSLNRCKCLITLSNYMYHYIINYVKKTPIKYLKHPTQTNDIQQFDETNLETICTRKDLSIVQLGQQLRYMTSIFKLKYSGNKIWLTGTSDIKKMKRLLTQECEWMDYKISSDDLDSVDIKYIKDLDVYKDIIYNNIILIDLIDASANNAILELAVARIPFFVKKLPAIVEYIGHGYPLFFDELVQVENIINNKDLLKQKLEHAVKYLNDLPFQDFSHDIFAAELLKIANEPV